MAITTYSELQTAIAAWNHRDPGKIPEFIALAEKTINSNLQSRIGEVETTLTATVDSRFIALPSGYMGNIGLWETTNGPRVEILFMPADRLPVADSDNSGTPRYYTISGSNIAFDYACSDEFTYDFRYKKGFDIASTSTNDILTNYPDVYLYGALVEAALYARDFDILDRWAARFEVALSSAQKAEMKNKALATLSIDGAIAGRNRSNILSGY